MKINNTGKEVFLCFSRVSRDEVGQRVCSQTVFTPCLNWGSHFFAFRGDFRHSLVSELTRCRLQADSSAQIISACGLNKESSGSGRADHIFKVAEGLFFSVAQNKVLHWASQITASTSDNSPETSTYVKNKSPKKQELFFKDFEYKNAQHEKTHNKGEWCKSVAGQQDLTVFPRFPVKTRQA